MAYLCVCEGCYYAQVSKSWIYKYMCIYIYYVYIYIYAPILRVSGSLRSASTFCLRISLSLGFSTGFKVSSVPRYYRLQRGLFHQAVLRTFCAHGAGWSAQKLFLHRGMDGDSKSDFYTRVFSPRRTKYKSEILQSTWSIGHHKALWTDMEVTLHSNKGCQQCWTSNILRNGCKLLARLHQDLVLKPMSPAARVWHFVTQGHRLNIFEFFWALTFNRTWKHI